MTIETERLLLRPFQEGDEEDVFEYLNVPAVNCFAGMKLHSLEGARRVYAYTEDYNKSSHRLCEKLGMRQEGLFKEFISFVKNPDGTPHYENTYQYAILKKEWDTK